MSKATKATRLLDEELKEAGFKAKVRRSGKRWPYKRGDGTIEIVITTGRHFKPGSGFAITFSMMEDNK